MKISLLSSFKHDGDRHVLATALLADAEIIATLNLKHFRLQDTITWEVEAQHPDTFLVGLLEKNREEIKTIITRQASRLKNPPLSVQQLLVQLAKQVPQFSQIMLEEVFGGEG
ncbi:MAG: putative ribonuclease VapC50 (plasmid) [Chroococcopsis gigantea SAG 12.99]|jgi:hypothetical protein|nr:putative ribonuclease VapC50 [Chroococcopsis gigantea SAG 12.99]